MKISMILTFLLTLLNIASARQNNQNSSAALGQVTGPTSNAVAQPDCPSPVVQSTTPPSQPTSISTSDSGTSTQGATEK